MLPELEQRNQEIVKTYINGATAEKVGKQFNLSYARVLEILKESNYHIRHRGKPDFTNRNKKIVELYVGGLSSAQIGKQFGLSRNRIIVILRENNQERRHGAPNRANLIGQKFGRLLVLKEESHKKSKTVFWLCKCDCGNETIVNTGTLRNGHTKSCGCLKSETTIKTFTKHGLSKSGKITPEYQIFHSAKKRANDSGLPFNLEYSDIVIPEYCPVFSEIKLMKNKGKIGLNSPTLDRLIPELGYVKGNVSVISNKANFIKNGYSLDELQKVVSWLECELNKLKT